MYFLKNKKITSFAKIIAFVLVLCVLVILPAVVVAQVGGGTGGGGEIGGGTGGGGEIGGGAGGGAVENQYLTPELVIFLNRIGTILSSFTLILAGLALLYFFWGLIKFIVRAGDEEGRKEGKKAMMWGIMALFVMVSIWGIVTLLQSAFALEEFEGSKEPPCLESAFFGNC